MAAGVFMAAQVPSEVCADITILIRRIIIQIPVESPSITAIIGVTPEMRHLPP
jgi:hypothetical protein